MHFKQKGIRTDKKYLNKNKNKSKILDEYEPCKYCNKTLVKVVYIEMAHEPFCRRCKKTLKQLKKNNPNVIQEVIT